MDLGGPELNDVLVVGAMQSIVDRLAPHAAIDGLKFKVHVVDSPVVNAFALPGGTMVVFTGLIENAKNADQVAAVLGHEMAHATLRHGLQRISHSIGIWAAVTLLVGDASGLFAAGADLVQLATLNSYSREQENAADEEGIRMLHAAAIDPTSMAQFFQLLEQQHGDLPGMLAWISTHPDHAARIENVQSRVASLPPREYQPLEIDWEQVQDRVRNSDSNQNGDG
jgi:predicted Zn-dependent protease